MMEMTHMENGPKFTISWKTCLKLIVSVAAIFLFTRYWGTFEGFVGVLLTGTLAIIAGLVIAYVLNIPLRFFERVLPGPKGDGTRNRLLALVLTVVCAIIVVLFLGAVVIPNLVEAVITLAQNAPDFIEALTDNKAIASFIPAQLLEQLESIDWESVVNDVASWLQSGVASSLPQVMSLFGQIGAWFMGIIFSFWFMGEKDKLSGNVHTLIQSYISKRADDGFKRVIRYADESFRSYIVAQSLEGVAFGALVAVVCVIAGIPGAPALGALVGVMSLIPMIGAIIGAILGAIIILAVSWEKALIFLVVFFIVQQIEQNFLYPRIVSKKVGLTGMWPLVGSTIGVAAFGFAGAFIGVPLIATIFRVIRDDLQRRNQLPAEELSPLEKLQKNLAD